MLIVLNTLVWIVVVLGVFFLTLTIINNYKKSNNTKTTSEYTTMRIFKEDDRLFSKDDTWVCICEGYLYTGDTLDDLKNVLNTEWKHDKHLAP